MLPPIDPVAVVTGGSYGAGREIARALASQGYAIVVVYLLDQDEAEAAVEEIIAAEGSAIAIRANMIDLLDVERLFVEAIAVFGGVDVVVHTAQHCSPVIDQQAARWLRHGGAIVHVACTATIDPALANELQGRNITIARVELASGSPRTRRGADVVSLLEEWRRRQAE